jgi:hypothetical protein
MEITWRAVLNMGIKSSGSITCGFAWPAGNLLNSQEFCSTDFFTKSVLETQHEDSKRDVAVTLSFNGFVQRTPNMRERERERERQYIWLLSLTKWTSKLNSLPLINSTESLTSTHTPALTHPWLSSPRPCSYG